MSGWIRTAVAAGAMAFATAGSAAEFDAAKAFGLREAVYQASLSPDGKHAAVIQPLRCAKVVPAILAFACLARSSSASTSASECGSKDLTSSPVVGLMVALLIGVVTLSRSAAGGGASTSLEPWHPRCLRAPST